MVRFISILAIVCICFTFTMKGISYAVSGNYKVSMKDHVEDVKLKHPEKYKTMIEKTGGNIKNCKSCHDIRIKGKKNPHQPSTDFPGK